jgi:hypothetical protein
MVVDVQFDENQNCIARRSSLEMIALGVWKSREPADLHAYGVPKNIAAVNFARTPRKRSPSLNNSQSER